MPGEAANQPFSNLPRRDLGLGLLRVLPRRKRREISLPVRDRSARLCLYPRRRIRFAPLGFKPPFFLRAIAVVFRFPTRGFLLLVDRGDALARIARAGP